MFVIIIYYNLLKMKSFVISMLFAAAAAQAGYECVNPGDAWTVETLGETPTDAATCKTACLTVIEANLDT